jgi:sulfur-oxidizing protein SoxY
MSELFAKYENTLERRDVLKLLGLGTMVTATGALVTGKAGATPGESNKHLSKLSGTSSYKTGKVQIKMPPIAENGATVPVNVSVDSPMTPDNYVKSIHIAAEKNPTPQVASFHLTPLSGKAEISTRMRLGKTQNVVAVAVMNDGSAHRVSTQVKVTIGGCGG